MAAIKPLSIIIDTREQKPYDFKFADPTPLITRLALKSGDYSLVDYKDKITIERKSMLDAFGSFGRGRKRFVKELERLSLFDLAIIIIEADWTRIFRNPPHRSKLKPKTIHSSIIAWEQRYNVHFWTVPNRQFAERTTYRILERYIKDQENHGSKKEKRKKES